MARTETVDHAAAGDGRRTHWPDELQKECEENFHSGVVGSVLVSETERVRIWHLRLPPGKRCPFHRHVLDYFWSCHSGGKARGWYDDGRIRDVEHYPGQTKHFTFARGEGFTHAVQNVGDTELLFTTVEFKQSANAPLPIPDAIRMRHPAE